MDIGWLPQGDVQRSDLCASEIRVSGIGGADERYDAALGQLLETTTELLSSAGCGLAQFRSEPEYSVPNRVRSYKGVFSELRYLTDHPVVERERESSTGPETVIAGLLAVRPDMYARSLRAALAYQRTFHLVSSRPLQTAPNPTFVDEMMDCLVGTTTVRFDYCKLVEASSSRGLMVLRLGGDAGETFVNAALLGRDLDVERVISNENIDPNILTRPDSKDPDPG